jgi:putative flippase GtrA
VIPGRIVRFALVGVLNTATYYGLYLLFGLFLPYLAAHVFAFVLSMIGSFFLNCHFTFRTKPTWRKFLLFPLSNVTNFVVTSVGLYVLVQFFGVNQRIAPLLAASVAIPITFLVAQIILTGRGKEPRIAVGSATQT